MTNLVVIHYNGVIDIHSVGEKCGIADAVMSFNIFLPYSFNSTVYDIQWKRLKTNECDTWYMNNYRDTLRSEDDKQILTPMLQT